MNCLPAAPESPSSRRAWIEIRLANRLTLYLTVALLAEGVDRNDTVLWIGRFYEGRPPRGGRR